MKHVIRLIFGSQLLSGSLAMIASSVIMNLCNYIYHLLMVRMLGPINYGALGSLFAIFALLAIPSASLNTVIVKFTSVYNVKKDYGKLYSLFRYFSEKFLILGIIVFLLFVLTQNAITSFLNIQETTAVVLVGSFLLFSLLSTVSGGILQGLLKFNFIAVNNIFGTLLKLGFGVLLVWMGFALNGAVLAVLIAYVLPYFLSLYPLKFLWSHKPERVKIDLKEMFVYSIPVTMAVLGLTSLYSLDIILVKHFFPSFDAGLYAALSIIGKIIFFASSTITIVMFPIISEKFEKGEHYKIVLYEAVMLVLAASILLTAIYFLWPELMMRLLYGSAYLKASPYLGIFAVYISVYSLSNLMVQFFLSIRKIKVGFFCLGAAFLQGVLIWIFHQNFFQVIYSSITAASLLLIALLVYYVLSVKELHLPAKKQSNRSTYEKGNKT